MCDWAPVITASAVAIPVLAAAVAAWLQGHANAGAIAEVHTLVNATHQASVDRVDQLEESLRTQGAAVPARPANHP